jgi:hypothetical protein
MKIVTFLALMASPLAAEVYELRTYTANEGKMEGLLARFRDHTTKIFESHGMKNIGYWLTEGKSPKLVYLITHKDRETAKKNWKAFGESGEDGFGEGREVDKEGGFEVFNAHGFFKTEMRICC